MKNIFKETVVKIAARAGVVVNGLGESDIQVTDERFYQRVLRGGSLALGESYMDGWWECPSLDKLFDKVFRTEIYKLVKLDFRTAFVLLKSIFFNRQSSSRASEVVEKHYDLGNDLYELMLDQRMVYTCGYWVNTKNLDEAQEAKLELICKKIGLKPGMRILDIGCGWGSFMKYAVEKYDVRAVGITLSENQVNLGKKLCEGLSIEFRLQDYRDLDTDEKFDRIVSIGMFEAVGYKNFQKFMEIANKCLVDDGLFLLHTIGRNYSGVAADPWMNKYIFPNGVLPSIKQIGASIEDLFVMEDWHNFGPDYDKTLMAWFSNFDANWHKIKYKYGEKFYRMWKYYLLVSAALFRSRELQLWQVVFSKKGWGKYESFR